MILASQSSPRKEILTNLGYQFTVCPSDYEEILDPHNSVEHNAERLATGKARDVFSKYPNEMVIGMDTIMVDEDGTYLEKPKDLEDAKKMMKNRSGKKEILVSGICIITPKGEFISSETSELYWKEFTSENLEHIFSTNEWEGKCGGIAIEGISGMYCSRIIGNFYNIMGVPINELWRGFESLSKKL